MQKIRELEAKPPDTVRRYDPEMKVMESECLNVTVRRVRGREKLRSGEQRHSRDVL